MFFKLSTIFFFLSFFSQSLMSSSQILYFTYNGFRDSLANISIQGITTITPNGLLKLTNTTAQNTGHAFYTKPIRFKDSPNGTVSSFSTTFVFAIHAEVRTVSAQGMAFVVAPNPGFPFSGPSRFLGLFNTTNDGDSTNNVFAVELDTIMNADLNDTNNNHVGIDINSVKSVKSSPAGYWDEKDQFTNLTLFNRTRMQVWVDYDGLTHQIDVTLAPFQKDKPRKPLVSIVRDLSSVLLQDMFVGFSSATGDILSEYYVLGWSFGVKGKAPPLDLSKLPILPDWDSKPTRVYVFYKNWIPMIALLLILLLFIISFFFLVRFIVRRRRKFAEEVEDWETEFKKNRLRFKDLYYATKGFKDKNLLGSGGFGKVYRGIMPITEKEIAVKRVSNESRQGLKEFVAEIVSIGQMSHRNIVPLLGYCRRRDELLLVYDYMPNGSLDKYLYDSPKVTLDWKQRFKVIKDVASGIFYLHEEWKQVVIHRDVKASNVLLDEAQWDTRGLWFISVVQSRVGSSNHAHRWNMGYLAPDHLRTGRPTTNTDVFAFGVLLLEVACGRRPIEVHKESGERVLLVDWVFGIWVEGNILNAKDPNLGSKYDQKEVEMVLKLGLLCSHSDPQVRPTMRQVLHYLRGDAMLPDFRHLGVRACRENTTDLVSQARLLLDLQFLILYSLAGGNFQDCVSYITLVEINHLQEIGEDHVLKYFSVVCLSEII